jgi:anaerobic magnesium-protoporphyrin IX monomethyl ester cyclase
MMARPRVTLISPYMLVTSYNVRLISAALRQAGFHTTKIFLPNLYPYSTVPAYDFSYKYEEELADQISALSQGSLWIGISTNTNLLLRTKALILELKKRTSIPIVYGGIHASIKPEECLSASDYIVMGEGEDTVVELSRALGDSDDPRKVPGVGVMEDGKPVYSIRTQEQQTAMGSLPWADYSLDDEWVQIKEARGLARMDINLFSIYSSVMPMGWNNRGPLYFSGASRGCPHRCSYCVHSFLARKFPEYRQLRIRPVADFVAELEHAYRAIPTLRGVACTDEDFLALDVEWLREFSAQYRKRVHLPMRIMGSADSISEEKVDLLVRAGMAFLEVGVQGIGTGVTSKYQRHWSNTDLFKEKAAILHKFRHQIELQYDVIMDNPEESLEEQQKTIKLLLDIKRPYKVQTFTLNYYPGSALYEEALSRGLIKDVIQQIYLKNIISPRASYPLFLFRMFWLKLPNLVIRIMSCMPLLRLFDSDGFRRLAEGIRHAWHRFRDSDSFPAYRLED